MKKARKIILALMLICVSVTLVSATLLNNFGRIDTTAHVIQAITIDGNDWDDYLTHEFEIGAGCCKCFPHTIYNNGCENVTVEFEHWATPNMAGITVIAVEDECGGCCLCYEETCGDLDDIMPVTIPFGESIDICLCYQFDTLLMPGTYEIHSKLVLFEP